MINIYRLLIHFTDEPQPPLYSLYDFELFWGGGAYLVDEGYIRAKCLNCGTLQALSFENIDHVSSSKRSMGTEKIYAGYVYEKCCNCSRGDEDGEISFYEYPEDSMDYIEYDSQYFTTDLLFSEYVSGILELFDKLSMNSQELFKRHLIQAIKPFEKLVEINKAISELERLISNPNIQESDLQRFFERKENWWMFGPDYTVAIPHPSSNDDIPDFALERYDGFVDLVELEKPYPSLFVRRGSDLVPNQKLDLGISQIDRYYERFFKGKVIVNGEERRTHRPKKILIIGRAKDSERDRLQSLRDERRDIDILTYDDIVERCKKTLSIAPSHRQRHIRSF